MTNAAATALLAERFPAVTGKITEHNVVTRSIPGGIIFSYANIIALVYKFDGRYYFATHKGLVGNA